MTITKLTKATKEALAEINVLLKQLRGEDRPGLFEDLQSIVEDEKVTMVVAKDGEKVVGVGTLYLIVKVGKRSGHIEDIVVDDTYRGQGLGQKITEALVADARKRKISKVYLTTRPERVAANKLYQKVGFKRKETNVYSIEL